MKILLALLGSFLFYFILLKFLISPILKILSKNKKKVIHHTRPQTKINDTNKWHKLAKLIERDGVPKYENEEDTLYVEEDPKALGGYRITIYYAKPDRDMFDLPDKYVDIAMIADESFNNNLVKADIAALI